MANPGTISKTSAVDVSIHAVVPESTAFSAAKAICGNSNKDDPNSAHLKCFIIDLNLLPHITPGIIKVLKLFNFLTKHFKLNI